MASKSSTVRTAISEKAGAQKSKAVSKPAKAESPKAQLDAKRQLKIQKALFEIADAASAVRDMESFYKKLHRIVGRLMYAKSLCIAIFDDQAGLISWPYYVDEAGDVAPEPVLLKDFRGGTSYVIRTGKALHTSRDMDRLVKLGEMQLEATRPVDAIGLPLRAGKKTLGAIAVQSYTPGITYTDEDVQVLTFVAQHIATALTRARALEAERQRTDELAILNSVGEAMAKTLDVKTVTKIVGDKVQSIFAGESVTIRLYGPATNLIHRAYDYDRVYLDLTDTSFPLGRGVTSKIIASGKPLVFGTVQESEAAGSIRVPQQVSTDAETESYMGVPIIAGDQVIGVVTVQSHKRYAYNESHVRLLETLASNMGVAIQNARLFEAEQERVAELAVINSVQEGLAKELDLQGIVDLVGEKVGEIFRADTTVALLYDADRDWTFNIYYMDRGKRTDFPAGPATRPSLGALVGDSRKPLLLHTATEAEALGAVRIASANEDVDKNESYLGVPILAADKVIGVIAVQSYQQNAYSDSDLRLLQTLANAMSVALQNAQSFKADQERVAELQIINSIQQGLASKLDFHAIIDLVGDQVRAITKAHSVFIALYDKASEMVSWPYFVTLGKRIEDQPEPLRKNITRRVLYASEPLNLGTEEEILAHDAIPPEGYTVGKSFLGVPFAIGDIMLGALSIHDVDTEHAFTEADARLLQTLANSMSVALENARLFDETQRLFKAEQERVAELQIINSIQQGLAAELDFQAIVDLVGDKLREVFSTPELMINWYDEKANLLHYLYLLDHSERASLRSHSPTPGGIFEALLKTCQPVVLNTDADRAKLNIPLAPGTDPVTGVAKSSVFIPIISSDRVLGSIGTANYERENAYGESELRLLTTIAASLGTALENARLFDETQQRNAELAIINSVQAALAAELNIQGIYEAVGDKLREIFHQADIGIRVYDPKTNLIHFPFFYDNGARISIESHPLADRGFAHHVIRNREMLVTNENMTQVMEQYDSHVLPGTVPPKSQVLVPLVVGDQGRGLIQIMDKEHEHAFSDSDVRLLQTLANAMSVALENARLFDETQRLLKVTEDRAAELAVINSVQAALAAELNIQGIYDAVGDKIREIFDHANVGIRIYDPQTGLLHYPYYWEDGKRIRFVSERLPDKGFGPHIIRTGETIVVNENMAEEMEKYGSYNLPGTGMSMSVAYVPMLVGEQVRGILGLVDNQHEHAFSDSDVRLLQTLANAMSVALENARLFDETQRLLKITEDRAAELAIINSVQASLAAKLDIQAIYDAVGDKIREIFHNTDMDIRIYDAKTDLLHFPYVYEKGKRISIESIVLGGRGFTAHVLRTRETLVFNKEHAQERERYGSFVLPGTNAPKSDILVPLVVGDQGRGLIQLKDNEREDAFGDSDVRLLQTLANAMSVALENARLFDETQRLFKAEQERVAELQIINSIQQGLAAELDFQAIVDLVGDKLRGVFNTPDLSITWYDEKANLVNYLYTYEHGKRFITPPTTPRSGGIYETEIKTRQPVIFNTLADYQKLGMTAPIPGTDMSLSLVSVPIISSDLFLGDISIENYERENAFGESELRLLTTIAASLGTALENARLFDEVQKKNVEISESLERETASNDILRVIAESPTDIQPVLDFIARSAAQLSGSDDALITLRSGGVLRVDAHYGNIPTFAAGEGIPFNRDSVVGRAILDGEPRQAIHKWRGKSEYPEGDKVARKYRYRVTCSVPLMRQGKAIGAISIRRVKPELLTDKQVALIQSFANQAAIAVENVRLFEAEQQRVAELQIINSVQAALAAELNIQGIYEAVGDKLREIFHNKDLGIRIYDPKTNLMDFPYGYENGKRVAVDSMPLPERGFGPHVLRNRETLVINENVEKEMEKFGSYILPGTEMSKSVVYVPLVVGDQARGLIELQDMQREHAFSESDVRLLQTLANSMSVALENARLFDETQRLLKITEDRAAELAIINSVQAALAAELNIQGIYDAVGDKIREIFHNKDVGIRIYDPKTKFIHIPYLYENGQPLIVESAPISGTGFGPHVIRSRETLVINENMAQAMEKYGSYVIPGTAALRAAVYVPLVVGDQARGLIQIVDTERENVFSESDVRLLQTLANAMSVALENARLFDETQRLLKETEQRNAELAIINSAQEGLVAKMDMQGIYDLVGDKIRDIFQAHTVSIVTYDTATELLFDSYSYEKGDRTTIPGSMPSFGFRKHVVESRKPLVVNRDVERLSAEYGNPILYGEPAKSCVFVPMLASDQVRGVLSLQNMDREDAFTESDVRLLQTLANSMSVALENARLFDETQRLLKITEDRAAELAIINGVQAALAAELNIQGIYDAVGDKIREIFHNTDLNIRIYDPQTNLIHTPYIYENGKRLNLESRPLSQGFSEYVLRTRETVVINEKLLDEEKKYGSFTIPGTESEKSVVFVPLVAGEQARGLINLTSMNEHAFSESDVRLLTTLANSMSVALENARLFDETQRLLKITEDRAAELAIINSVQASLAAKLDIQAIYDAVGDKIREIFHQGDVGIRLYDPKTNLMHFPYAYENGVRMSSVPLPARGFGAHVVRTRETLVINENMAQAMEKYDSYTMPGTQMAKSSVYVPLVVGDQACGLIILSDMEREHAFGDSDVRLLQTLANAMSVALENARLFDETQRLLKITEDRAAELAIINSVQEGLASKLDMQAIYDLVGDKIQGMFNAQSVVISSFDHEKQVSHLEYAYENGERVLDTALLPFSSMNRHLITSRQPVVINANAVEESKRYGLTVIEGTQTPRSLIYVPFGAGTQVNGYFSLQNFDRENAFAESDVRLLQTLAGSMGIALENARLFNAEQQRNAELAIINSVQEALASKLEMQAIYDAVGDKIREIFDAQVVDIGLYDSRDDLIHFPYTIERGVRFPDEPSQLIGYRKHVIQTRQSLLIGEFTPEVKEQYDQPGPIQGEAAISGLFMPMMVGNEAKGVISLQNLDRPNAFAESDVRLLQTLANSMSVALENARLFDETQQRNAELAIINSVQEALASKLEMQAIYDAVGEEIREIFDAQVVAIVINNREDGLAHFPYAIEKGERLRISPIPPAGISGHIFKTGQPVLINESIAQRETELLGRPTPTIAGAQTKSRLDVPMIVAKEVRGVISLQNVDRENAFSQSDLRLLTTLANSMSVALENARLFDETQRLLQVTEDRAAELAVINSIQQGLAAELNFQAIVDLVGDKLREVLNTGEIGIRWYDPQANLIHYLYEYEHGVRLTIPSAPPRSPRWFKIVETRQPSVVNSLAEAESVGAGVLPGTDRSRSSVSVPIIGSDRVVGSIIVEDYEKDYAFSESDVRLLSTVAASMGVALENARLFDETQRLLKETEERNAELAIINSVQAALAAELNIQGIYDAVGDKIREIFHQADMGIRIFDTQTNLVHYPYTYENGARINIESRPLSEKGFSAHILRTRETLVINENMAEAEKKYGSFTLVGTAESKSELFVPLIVGEQARGLINLSDYQREHAFSDSDVRLLQTLANSMSVALENARLFDETQRLFKAEQQRAAELAVISSIQEGMAAELNFQAIVDLVGDKLREVFKTGEIGIRWLDQETGQINYLYEYEHGERIQIPSAMPPAASAWHKLVATRQPLVFNTVADYGDMPQVPGTDQGKSMVTVPIIGSDRVLGSIILENYEHEYAYGESEVRLLSTVAASMGVALENARLFDETQRLLKITEERAEELAIINSVQAGLASQLDIQTIFDLVGDKIRDTFDAQAVAIFTYDRRTNLIHYPYIIERGQRQTQEPLPLIDKGFGPQAMRTRQPVMINEDLTARAAEVGSFIIGGGEAAKSGIWVPLVIGDEARGVISIQNIDREHAFDDSDFRLLTTLASSLSVAFENARLFDETQRLLKETEQRNAELAIINKVQQGLASKLEMQAIYDLVGDEIRSLFDAQAVLIVTYDREANLFHYPYNIEKGERYFVDPTQPMGLSGHMLKTRQPILIRSDFADRFFEITGLQSIDFSGEYPKSWLGVPLLVGDEVRGTISLQNVDREEAFGESDLRLLGTLAGTMSVALENARLFDETQRLLKETADRAAELAIINSISQVLAQELDLESLMDLVGDKLRAALQTGNLGIGLYDKASGLLNPVYVYRDGERVHPDPAPLTSISLRLARQGKSLVMNEVTAEAWKKYGSSLTYGKGRPESVVMIPILAGGDLIGGVTIQGFKKQDAFPASMVSLLETIASNVGTAIQKARLFDETRRLLDETEQRNKDLAAINSISQVLANSQLDFGGSITMIGDKLEELFGAQYIYIALCDEQRRKISFPYFWADGQLVRDDTEFEYGEGITAHVLRTRQPLLFNTEASRHLEELGAVIASYSKALKSSLIVPILANEQAIGTLALQSSLKDNLFSEADVRLLTIIASNIGVSLQNARLFDETQRLLREMEQRAQELSIINSVQEGLASKLDMQAIYDLVGNKICELFSLQTCYIMLYDKERDVEHYPFLVDNGKRETLEDLPHDENGFGPLVMRTRQPIMINEDMDGRSKEVGSYDIGPEGEEPKSAIYVPLLIGDEARGVISVQNSEREHAYTESDLRLMATLASSMSVALESARLFAETEQRAAELAIINSVQQGLASKLEVQAIYDLVGDRLRDLFDQQAVSLLSFDLEKNTFHYHYLFEKGRRLEVPDAPITPMGRHIISSGKTLLVNERVTDKLAELGVALQLLPGTEPTKALLRVPIFVGGEVRGLIGLSNLDQENAFTSPDVRLLETLASSLSVALESARLFAETEQRAAELAIINSVQQGLASKLEVRAIYDLVGDKLRQLFDTQAISLASFDLEKNALHFHYLFERGLRLDTPDTPIPQMSQHIIATRAPLLINERFVESLAALGINLHIVPGTELPKSVLRVPILISGQVRGVIGLDNLDHENAFSASDVRLLQTLAGSLSVAIESARLFEETKRNAAELATVNTVSSALASELDTSALIDLVGEQIRSIFRADIAYVALLDESGQTISFPYTHGEAMEDMPYGEGLTSKIIQTGEPLLITRDVGRQAEEMGASFIGVAARSYLGVPIMVGSRAVGVVSVQSTSREDAFDPNDQRLLTTIAANVGSALQNAQLYREAQESRAAAEQANKAKSTFLANMSHELRTPLNAIIGFTRIVRRKAEGALPDKQIENLEKVLSSSEHLLGLINTVLDIAKIEAGRMDVVAANFSIASLADQCANLAAPLLKPNVRLEKAVDDSLGLIYSDQDKIKQIVLNLLSNAAKFTHEGKIRLAVDRRDADMLDISVTDSGIGISEEALGRVFEEFQQADTSTTRQYGGTGLGLAISRSLARLLGGDLTAASQPGVGSTFTLALPIKYGTRPSVSATTETVGTPKADSASGADGARKNILVIDDDPDAVYLLQENLNPNEFNVIGTRNGHDGLQVARDRQPDAIMLDILMPEVDGWQVLNDLKEDPATTEIPVILLTIVDKKALGFRLGAAAYLLKPLDPPVVLEALRRVIGERGEQQKHVLIVDDDPNVAEMLGQILTGHGFELEAAEDGEAGLRAVEARRPDVILLDLMMPKLDGFGVIERLRADPSTRDIPIIVISAKELTEPESRKLRDSVAFVMQKQGFDGEKLVQELTSVLQS
jgi:GAF domain-containing protein/CheY-like chemotaxis protein